MYAGKSNSHLARKVLHRYRSGDHSGDHSANGTHGTTLFWKATKHYRFVRYAIIIFCSLLFVFPHSAFAQTPIIQENGPVQALDGMPLYGNYCTVAAGVSLRDEPYSDTFVIDVPGTPVRSYWYWTGRSRVAPFAGDDTFVVDHNGNGPQTVTAGEAYSSHELSGEWIWYTYFYNDDAFEHVISGTNTYTVSDLNIGALNNENHGVGMLTVYESADCPVTRINASYGLDSFRFNNTTRDGDAFGPDSELICEEFEPASFDRTMTVSLAVGGVAGPDRGNSIWTYTDSGTPPTSITPDADDVSFPGAIEIEDPLNNNPGREWDFFSDQLPVPAGSTYLCLQLESPEDDRGVSAVLAGAVAAMEMGDPAIDIQKTPDMQIVESGSTVTFTIRVENTGEVDLTDVIVSDPLAPNCDATFDSMPVGAVETYDCTLDNVTADFTNVASVTATPPEGPPVTGEDDADVVVTVPANPAIDIQKTPDMQTVVNGSTVTFTIRVENTGDVALTDVIVTDPLAPSCDAAFGSLAVGAVETYECTLDNVTADFTNVAAVTGEPQNGDPTVSDEDDADVVVTIPQMPAIDIQKTPDMQTVVSGSTVTFTIRVENTGNVVLTEVIVTDPLAPNCDTNFAQLDIGAVETYECTLDNVTADFTNIASVTGEPLNGDPTVSDEDDADVVVTIPPMPAIDIQKTPDTQTIVSGSTVTFTIRVENTGNVDLTNVIVTDPLAPNCDATFDSLAVGAVETYDCTLDNVAADFTNVASVTGTPPEGDPVTDEDDADVVVTIAPMPAIDIQKTPDTQTVVSGSTVTFTIRVENTGNVDLTNVIVTDPLAPNCDATFDSLAVGAVETYDCTLDNVAADFTNVASVIGTPPEGDPVTDEDDADVVVTIPNMPAIDIQKTPDTQTVESGSTVTFTIRVENTGNVDLTNVIVTDPLAPNCDETFDSLAVGAVATYECTLDNVTADFTNVASVIGTPPEGDPVTDEDDADVVVLPVTFPILMIDKTDNGAVVQPGDLIKYSLTYTNSGTADAIGVEINEIVPDFTTFDVDQSDSRWICEADPAVSGTVCTLPLGTVPANSTSQEPIVFAVEVDTVLPDTVTSIINQVVIRGDNDPVPDGGSRIDLEETPYVPPTAIDVIGEPAAPAQADRFIFVPFLQR